jgi:hypothetical protein
MAGGGTQGVKGILMIEVENLPLDQSVCAGTSVRQVGERLRTAFEDSRS